MSSTTKVTATTMFALISVSFCFASYESEKQLESRYLNATEKVTLVADGTHQPPPPPTPPGPGTVRLDQTLVVTFA